MMMDYSKHKVIYLILLHQTVFDNFCIQGWELIIVAAVSL